MVVIEALVGAAPVQLVLGQPSKETELSDFCFDLLLERHTSCLGRRYCTSDADYLLYLRQHHRERLRPWRPDDEQTRTLQMLVQHGRRLLNDRTRISNRLTALLKGYFPQVLAWSPDLCTLLVCDLLTRWPTLSAAPKARPATLLQFFKAHHSVRAATNERRLTELRLALPLTTDGAVLNPSLPMVKVLVAQMRTVLAAIAEFDRQIAALCQTHAELFDATLMLKETAAILSSKQVPSFCCRARCGAWLGGTGECFAIIKISPSV